METNIILDEKSVEKIVKDPKVKAKIENAVIDSLSKSLTIAFEKKVMAAMNDLILSILHNCLSDVMYARKDTNEVFVTTKARDVIRKAIEQEFRSYVDNEVFRRIGEQTDRLKKRVDEVMSSMTSEHLSGIVRRVAADFFEKAMEKAFDK